MADTAAIQTFTEENPQFTLYSHDTGPNGFKVAELLSELGLTYKTVFLDFGNGPNGMKTPFFENLNPNGRIPAIVDHANGDFVLWESIAIILYILKKYDTEYKFWAKSIEDQALIEQWMLYQATGQGPYLGQAMWFTHYHPEKVQSAMTRYTDETRRVLGIVEKQLSREGSNGWIVLGRITAADISFLHWWCLAFRIGIEIETEFPVVHAWMEKLKAREGVAKGMTGAQFPKGEVEIKGLN
ncbi:glutathione S-transferase C-terminal-like protein [Pyronema domesticum]|uniref:Similar to Glutathione S-transferase 1 acc. no. Q9Y7Q2 n=1 Tax=Pyronema omphalodes (strain CBS 100304) TaxID=1076935 RepID=U4L6Y9_PYROM|nr:glutathione S-transferase C-terminal-like protein [Pyronema domesticum]CCX08378.1 Similar to Glutathione S-transferase 1; acc. no. Q9Y7Q2 [Pyronema omphalodes CBS 100304]